MNDRRIEKSLITFLRERRACPDARDWVNQHKHVFSETSWIWCDRGEWMLWLLDRLVHVEGKTLSAISYSCAERALLIHGPAPELVEEMMLALQVAQSDVRSETWSTIFDLSQRLRRSRTWKTREEYALVKAFSYLGCAGSAPFLEYASHAVSAKDPGYSAWCASKIREIVPWSKMKEMLLADQEMGML